MQLIVNKKQFQFKSWPFNSCLVNTQFSFWIFIPSLGLDKDDFQYNKLCQRISYLKQFENKCSLHN
jgi:hypothetical protein